MQYTDPLATSPMGAVFTPLSWAVWVIEQYKLGEEWMKGATFLDPTVGEGAFLESFIAWAIHKGIDTTTLPLENLFGICVHLVYPLY